MNIFERKNFLNLVVDLRMVTNIWRQQWLSLAGKIHVFKSLAISKPVFIGNVRSVPHKVVNSLQTIHKQFIWDAKGPNIKHSTLVSDKPNGDLNDVDMEAKLKCLKSFWIAKLLETENAHPWKAITNELLTHVGGSNISHSNLDFSSEFAWNLKKIPIFYQDLINVFMEMPKSVELTPIFFTDQYLWNVCFVVQYDKSLYNKHFMKQGIQYISDLMDDHGNFKSWEFSICLFKP